MIKKKLTLRKFRISKLQNLHSIMGGNDGDGDPQRSRRPGCPGFSTNTKN